MSETRSFIRLAALYSILGLVGLALGSPKALALVAILAILTLLRYAAMAKATRSLGGPLLPLILYWSLWLTAFVALGIVLYVVGLKARSLLPWGASAALIGPLAISLVTALRGLKALVAPKEEATA